MILKYFASGDRLRAEQGNNGPNPPPLPAPPTRGNPPILQVKINFYHARHESVLGYKNKIYFNRLIFNNLADRLECTSSCRRSR